MIERVRQSIEEIEIVLIDEGMILETEQWLHACEHCSENAPIAFDYLLDELTGCDSATTEYLMRRQAHCPSCSSEITEKTLVAV